MVSAPVIGVALAAQMMIHLDIENAPGQCLLAIIEQSARIKGRASVTACQ